MRRVALILALLVGMVLIPSSTAHAAEFRSGDTIIISSSETINDDLYVAGNSVRISGTVRGDVVVAANTIVIDGRIEGNLNAAGNSITLSGPVDRSVRAAGTTIILSSTVGRDILAGGTTITIERSAAVGNDAVLGGTTVTLDGNVGRDLKAGATTATVTGMVGRNAIFDNVNALTIGSAARITGSVQYRSDRDAAIQQGATVGSIEKLPPNQDTAPSETNIAGRIVGTLISLVRTFIGIFVLGLLWRWLFKDAADRVSATVVNAALPSLGIGCLTMLVAPLAFLVVLVVGAVIGGWGIPVIAGLGLIVLLLLSGAVVARPVGQLILTAARQTAGPVIHLLIGAAVLALLSVIPVLNVIVSILVGAVGVGAVLVAIYRRNQTIRLDKPDTAQPVY